MRDERSGGGDTVHEGGGGSGGIGSDTTALVGLPSKSPRARLLGHRCTDAFSSLFSSGIGDSCLFLLYELGVELVTSGEKDVLYYCLLYTSPSPRDQRGSRMPSSA